MKNTKLSKLQKFILQKTCRYGKIQNSDILILWYGFQPSPRGRLNFDRNQIGIRRYLITSASLFQSLTRLRKRGLMKRGPCGVWGHVLTSSGREVAQQLRNDNTVVVTTRA